MKFVITILLTGLLSFITGLYGPWWAFALAAFLVAALIPQRPGMAFLSGFLALFLLWGILAWTIDNANGHILSRKIAQILPLGGNTLLLILVTAFVAALIGGGSALTASFIQKKKSE